MPATSTSTRSDAPERSWSWSTEYPGMSDREEEELLTADECLEMMPTPEEFGAALRGESVDE